MDRYLRESAAVSSGVAARQQRVLGRWQEPVPTRPARHAYSTTRLASATTCSAADQFPAGSVPAGSVPAHELHEQLTHHRHGHPRRAGEHLDRRAVGERWSAGGSPRQHPPREEHSLPLTSADDPGHGLLPSARRLVVHRAQLGVNGRLRPELDPHDHSSRTHQPGSCMSISLSSRWCASAMPASSALCRSKARLPRCAAGRR